MRSIWRIRHVFAGCFLGTAGGLLIMLAGCSGDGVESLPSGAQSAVVERALLRQRGAGGLPPIENKHRDGTTAVLLIGVNYTSSEFAWGYSERLPPLHSAAADVQLLRADFESYGVAPESIYTLTNESATTDEIQAVFDHLAESARPEDTIIVFFGGHGVGQSEATSALVCYDKYLSIQEFLSALGRVGAGRCILLLDACHSGAPGQPAFVVNSDSLQLQTGGLAWISAARAEQLAYEDDAVGHGLFTSALSAVLAKPADYDGDQDGWLDFEEVGRSIQLLVESRSRELGGLQQPTFGTVAWQESSKFVSIRDPWDVEVLAPIHRAPVHIKYSPSEIKPNHHLWLVVYPQSTGAYWPQPHIRFAASDGGDLSGMVYLGLEDGTGIGDRFTVALVEADAELDAKLARQGTIHDGMYDPPYRELPVLAEQTVTRER